MTHEEFDELLRYSMHKSKNVLASKADEYASDTDRLQNFKRAGAMDDETPEKACWGMLKKHLISIGDIIADAEKGKYPTHERLFEKTGDAKNYLYLLEAIVCETIGMPEDLKPAIPLMAEAKTKKGKR